jgi:hypothetical protein
VHAGDLLRALLTVDEIPAGLSWAELQSRLGERFLDLQLWLGTCESLGIMVSHGEVDLALVDDFFSGTIVHSWARLRRLVDDVRAETARALGYPARGRFSSVRQVEGSGFVAGSVR